MASNWLKKLRLGSALLLFALSRSIFAQEGTADVVYVPTPQSVVDEMLRMAHVGSNDYLIDLGSGDGRIVITAAKKFGARGLGVELDKFLLNVARQSAKKEGVTDRSRFLEQNLFETDLRKATVIATYLLPEMNLKLRPKILSLKPGTRVVAHDYHMGDWYPDEQRDMKVPEKTVGTAGISYLYLWIVPKIVAGKWQSQFAMDGTNTNCQIKLSQEFQMIEGTLRLGKEIASVRGRVNGLEVTFKTDSKNSPGGQLYEFSGRVNGETIAGTVRIGEGEAAHEAKWSARR